LLPIAVIFLSMSRIVLGMTSGTPSAPVPAREKESAWLLAPPLVLAALSLLLGLAIPAALNRNLQQAVSSVHGAEPVTAPAAPRVEGKAWLVHNR
jgi:formate hydrogenlyase subunit 3/multisubunit Na+/H+ antiporter MnhD subunit